MKSESLHQWFNHNHGKGWIDCKRSKGHLVSLIVPSSGRYILMFDIKRLPVDERKVEKESTQPVGPR